MHLQSAKATRDLEGLVTPALVVVSILARVVAHTLVPEGVHTLVRAVVVTPGQVVEPIRVPAAEPIQAQVVVLTLALAVLATLVLVVRHTTNGTARLRIVSSVKKVSPNNHVNLDGPNLRRFAMQLRPASYAKR